MRSQFVFNENAWIRFCHIIWCNKPTIYPLLSYNIGYIRFCQKRFWGVARIFMTKADIREIGWQKRISMMAHFYCLGLSSQIIFWQKRIYVMLYDKIGYHSCFMKSGYLTDLRLDSKFSNILRVHICRKSILSIVLNACNKLIW